VKREIKGKGGTNWIRSISIIGWKKDIKWRMVDKSIEYLQD